MVNGARAFVADLWDRGVTLYLASGTDHPHVIREAQALGLSSYSEVRVYGALDENEAHDKATLIRRILKENQLSAGELMVVGDGPVEIREAASVQAIALSVASDEITCSGWSGKKVRRLADAGADLLVADFSNARALIDLLVGPSHNEK